VDFVSRQPIDDDTNISIPSTSAGDPTDALTDNATLGKPLGDTQEGHEDGVDPIAAGPAGTESVLPTPAQTLVTSETTVSSADVSVQIMSASNVNN
jgi:hypothetical protein